MAAPPLKVARTCSQCGNNGHNARTCTDQTAANATTTATTTTTTGSNSVNHGVMLFGVRLTPMDSSPSPRSPASAASSSSSGFRNRKCMSMNNLAQYEQQQLQHQNSHDSAADIGGSGYASDDALHASGSRNRERKRGVPWTEDEHMLFLMGLNQVGKGDWRGIAKNFVKTRTPTQVASHAQKYFQRRTNNPNRRRRRSSLFDITTDTMSRSASADQLNNLDTTFQPKQAAANQPTVFSATIPPPPPTSLPNSTNQSPPFSKMANLNLNQSPTSSTSTTSTTREREFEPFLSLNLPQAPSDEGSSRHPNAFGGFNGSGESIISVA